MNLSAIISAVYTETGRPDLVDETLGKIISTTQALHMVDYYRRDIRSARVGFDYLSYLQQLDKMSLPLFRKMAWIKRSDKNLFDPSNIQQPQGGQLPPLYPFWASAGDDTKVLKQIDGDDIFNVNGFLKTDVFYQAGDQINMRSSWAFQWAQIGWYARPQLGSTDDTFVSWIADDYPYAIIYLSAGNLLRSQGMTDDSLQYTNSTPRRDGGIGTGIGDEQAMLIKMNEIESEGR